MRFGGVVEVAENGALHRTLFAETFGGHYEFRGTGATIVTFGPDGKPFTPPPRPTNVQAWAELADEDDLLEDALIYFGRSTDWFDIYKALECVFMRAGGEEDYLTLG